MLERESLDRFYADEILYRGQLLAQGKVVRLWRKQDQGSDKMVTKLTFLAREERQREWDTVQFSRTVDIDGDKVILREDHKSSATNTSTTDHRELVIKFRPPPTTRKQSLSTTAKKRERRPSGQSPSPSPSPGAEEKRPQPERKKSTWSLRRFSRTGTAKETLSPDPAATLSRSPESFSPGPSSAGSGYRFDDSHDAIDETDKNTAAGKVKKSDAERFKEVFQKFHPSSTPDFKPLPPIATGDPLGWGDGGETFKTTFGFTVNNSGYTFEERKGHGYASSIATSMSSPASPKTELLPSSSSGTTTCSGHGGGVIRPRLEGLYPP